MDIINTKDFVTTSKTDLEIAEEDYLQLMQPFESILDSAAQLSGAGVYIFDHSKHKFLYVSPNISQWYGVDADVVMEKGYDLYVEHVPQDDLAMLKKINIIGFEKFESLPEEERRRYSISYNFRFNVNGKLRMINHRSTPLVIKDNQLWLALCYVSMSISKEPGNVILRNTIEKTYSEYNFITRRWTTKKPSPLTEKDKELIYLIAQGMTNEGIAEKMHKSPETIKSYRRDLLGKLGMHNFINVLYYHISYGMFQEYE